MARCIQVGDDGLPKPPKKPRKMKLPPGWP